MEKMNSTAYYGKYRDMALNKDLIIGNIANDRMFFVNMWWFHKRDVMRFAWNPK